MVGHGLQKKNEYLLVSYQFTFPNYDSPKKTGLFLVFLLFCTSYFYFFVIFVTIVVFLLVFVTFVIFLLFYALPRFITSRPISHSALTGGRFYSHRCPFISAPNLSFQYSFFFVSFSLDLPLFFSFRLMSPVIAPSIRVFTSRAREMSAFKGRILFVVLVVVVAVVRTSGEIAVVCGSESK